MIFDLKENLNYYKSLGIKGRYEKAIKFLQENDLENMEVGKYEIDGKDVYAMIQEYATIEWDAAKYEAHHNYTDIQYIISGSETMGYAPIGVLKEAAAYNPDKDVVLYDNSVTGLKVEVKSGEFMIFAPQDGHKPKACTGSPSMVKKAVVKIKEV